MHILLINDDLPPEILGGSGRVVVEVATALAAARHRVTILSASNKPVSAFPLPGIEIRLIPRLPNRWAHYRSVFSRSRTTRLVDLIHEIHPDVIHAHALAWQMGYRWLDTIGDEIPCFYTAHGMMTIAYGKLEGTEKHPWIKDLRRARWTFNPLRTLLIRRSFRHLTKMLCVSDALRMFLAQHGHTNMQTLHNGVDIDFWKPILSKEDAKKKLDLSPASTTFLLAGRLGHDKGLDLLLDIWPTLSGNRTLLLVGQIPPIAPEKLSPSIRLIGPQDPEGMRLLYNATDVTLVPSLCFDCFPTTSIESMACGVPVLLTTFGGGKEALIDGKTGWLVDPRQAPVVREKIQWCIDHAAELPTFGKAARDHMAAHFTQTQHIETLTALYASALMHVPSRH